MKPSFPKNYDDARAQFLAEAERAKAQHPGAEVRSFNVPSASDPNLYVDELFVPSIASPISLLILTSGVHGLEASAGSAVQTLFIKDLLAKAAEKGVAVWIVHCLNPWGYKYGRRNTEENINLNRNFGPSYSVPNVDFKHIALSLSRAAGTLSTLIFLLKEAALTSQRRLSQAVSQGQFTHPKNLEYGGTGPTPQAAYFRERFEEIEQPFEEIVMIDLHTGLGDNAKLHLLTGFDVDKCVHKDSFARLFIPEKESDLYSFKRGDEKGFYQTIGDINSMVADAAPMKKVVALTAEFGTLGNGLLAKADSLARLRSENYWYHQGVKKPQVSRKFRELFEPQDPAWQKNVLRLSRELLTRLVQRL